jgi:hypothetical protein
MQVAITRFARPVRPIESVLPAAPLRHFTPRPINATPSGQSPRPTRLALFAPHNVASQCRLPNAFGRLLSARCASLRKRFTFPVVSLARLEYSVQSASPFSFWDKWLLEFNDPPQRDSNCDPANATRLNLPRETLPPVLVLSGLNTTVLVNRKKIPGETGLVSVREPRITLCNVKGIV